MHQSGIPSEKSDHVVGLRLPGVKHIKGSSYFIFNDYPTRKEAEEIVKKHHGKISTVQDGKPSYQWFEIVPIMYAANHGKDIKTSYAVYSRYSKQKPKE